MDARFERRVVRTKCALELVIPIGPIFVDDFLQYGLENFIAGFRQSVRLRVVRCAFLVHNRVMVCERTYYLIDEVSTLVTNELYWTSVTEPEVLIHKFSRGLALFRNREPSAGVVHGPIPIRGCTLHKGATDGDV